MKQIKHAMESKWVQVAHYSLHYRVPRYQLPQDHLAIVMVHGLVVSSRYMLPTAEQLAISYRVYIPDLPGFGKSEQPDHFQNLDEMADILAAWMQCVGLSRAVLLGNSLGCQIIARFAVRHPQMLHTVILLDPTMDRRARTAHQQIGRWLINIIFEPSSLYPLVLRDFLDSGIRRFLATFRYGLQDEIETFLPHISVPTLVVRGSRDTVVPQAWAEYVAQLLPQGTLVVLEDAAHDVNYNAPGKLVKVIRQFLTSLN
jgi:pimeloyl-ACP methyl ester carboxylesterase